MSKKNKAGDTAPSEGPKRDVIGLVRGIFHVLSTIALLTAIGSLLYFSDPAIMGVAKKVQIPAFGAFCFFTMVSGILALFGKKKGQAVDGQSNSEELQSVRALAEKAQSEASTAIQLSQELHSQEYERLKTVNEELREQLDQYSKDEREKLLQQVGELREQNSGLVKKLHELASNANSENDLVGDIHAVNS